MYKLSPSDFAYLYSDCKLCYYLKIKHHISPPSMPMPGVFSAINTRLQTPLVGKNTRLISDQIPAAKIIAQERFVRSEIIPNTTLYISGKCDLLAQKPDGSYLLIDLKISQPHEDKTSKYSSQLAAYRFALEHPAEGTPLTISSIGLLIFYPDTVSFSLNSTDIAFPATWLEVKTDPHHFLKLASDINTLLAGPLPPENPNCQWCQYRHVNENLSPPTSQPSLPF